MEAKLIKDALGYYLKDVSGYKLSLKNCQTIENGYDLDELIIECVKNTINQETGSDIHKLSIALGFQKGFQKALELLGDKKFSENELYKIWKAGQEYWKTSGESITFEELIERKGELLQQTEWDVEIEMICPHPQDTYVCGIQYGCDEDGCNHPNQVPVLDADGCLILKRK